MTCRTFLVSRNKVWKSAKLLSGFFFTFVDPVMLLIIVKRSALVVQFEPFICDQPQPLCVNYGAHGRWSWFCLANWAGKGQWFPELLSAGVRLTVTRLYSAYSRESRFPRPTADYFSRYFVDANNRVHGLEPHECDHFTTPLAFKLVPWLHLVWGCLPNRRLRYEVQECLSMKYPTEDSCRKTSAVSHLSRQKGAFVFQTLDVHSVVLWRCERVKMFLFKTWYRLIEKYI